VLLADLAMPREDGYALIRKVRGLPAERGGAVPAAALTAHASGNDRTRVLAAGFQMHLPKPVDPGALAAAVARLGRARRAS
jgi:CheY-like chemotaxis protein